MNVLKKSSKIQDSLHPNPKTKTTLRKQKIVAEGHKKKISYLFVHKRIQCQTKKKMELGTLCKTTF